MFQLDTLRLIAKTKKRFLSLTLIVMIGIAFMMGLLSSPVLMRSNLDRINDAYHLQDLQIYSQYGFCLEDYLSLKESENIDRIFASKTIDMEALINGETPIVVRVSEMSRSINQYKLVSGNLPVQDNQCVIAVNEMNDINYRIGDHLILSYGNDNVEDYLKYHDYMIVGMVHSPAYIAKITETSNYKNKELDLVIYIPNDDFISDYYTTIYITLDGADDCLSYTDEYKELVDEKSDDIESIAFIQQDYLKEQIRQEGQEQLDEAMEEFKRLKEEGERELEDAANRLNDANIKITAYETEIEALQILINRLNTTLVEHNDDIIDANQQMLDFFDKYDLDPKKFYAQEIQDYARASLEEAQEQYDSLVYQVANARKQYDEGLEQYKEALITFNEEVENADMEIRKAQQDLDELPGAKWTILNRNYHYSSYMFDGSCSQMESISYTLPFIFFMVAALVCLTTMKRLVDEQRGQIGIFVALGFSKHQIIMKYVIYALAASLIGGILGILFGNIIFPTVIYNTWRLMYVLPEMQLFYPFRFVVICLLSFIILMSTVTAMVVNDVLKESPALLLRPKAPKNGSTIFLEHIKSIWDRISFTSKITARNLFRYKARFFMTVLGVAGCTGLLIIGWGIKDSIADVVDIQYGQIFNYDYHIQLENTRHLEENMDILKSNLNNETVASYMSFTSKVYLDNDDDTAEMIVIDPRDAFLIFKLNNIKDDTEFRLSNEGIIISNKFARNNSIKAGDYVTVESKNGIKAQVKVAGICEMYFQHYIFISNALYQNLFDEKINDTTIAIKSNDPLSLQQDCEKLQDFISLYDFDTMIRQFETMIKALDLIILVIIITAGSLAFVVLMNLTQVNISERIREIATLKVLGFNDHEVNLYIFKEILLLTLIGALLGMPLGVLEHHYVMNVINMEMIMFGMNIKLMSFIYAFVITFVFTMIVLLSVRRPLREVNMVESLKSVE